MPVCRANTSLAVFGAAPCLFDDAARLFAEYGLMDVCAVNGAGLWYQGDIRYWCSYHPSCFADAGDGWMRQRRQAGWNGDFMTVAHKQCGMLVDIVVNDPFKTSGSSVLLAVWFGLLDGYREIYVAGAPLDDPAYQRYRKGWELVRPLFNGRVKSMSGWTKHFLERV